MSEGLLLNPVYPVVSEMLQDPGCGLCVQSTEAWVVQKRDPNAEILGPNIFVEEQLFYGPEAPDNMATWMAQDEEGSFYVLARRQPNAATKPWYVLTKFDQCGNLVNSIHINKGQGFGHYLDVTKNPQICCGPQGVVIVASPVFDRRIPGLMQSTPLWATRNSTEAWPQSNPFHVVACFNTSSLNLRWSIITTSGQPGVYDLQGIYANKQTGHTYLFEHVAGGGVNSGDIGLTVISQDGKITSRILFGLPNGGFFGPIQNAIDHVLTLPDGRFIVFGAHGRNDSGFFFGQKGFTWSIMISANGSTIERDYVVSHFSTDTESDPLTMTDLGACVRNDGKILAKASSGGTFVLNSDATSVLEAWSEDWGYVGSPGNDWSGREQSDQLYTDKSGAIWCIETAFAAVDLPTDGWNSFPPVFNSGYTAARLVTLRVRKLSHDGKYLLAGKSVWIGGAVPGTLANPGGVPGALASPGKSGYALDTIGENGRVGLLVAGWGLSSFSLGGKTVGFNLSPSYPGVKFETINQATVAKFAKWTGVSPQFIAGGSFQLPTVNSPTPTFMELSGMSAVRPAILEAGETVAFPLSAEQSASDVRWDRYASSEINE
jgi:hypothetical protein